MRNLFVAAACAALALNVTAQNGLIARYQLNNNANDSAGPNHGSIVGAIPVLDRFNQANAAYSFDGSSSRIEFNGPPPFNQINSWTVAAWIKPASFSQSGLAVYVGLDNGASSDGFGFGLAGSAALQAFLPGAGGFVTSGASFPSVTEWTHVVMERTNGIISFYINGAKTPNTTTAPVTPPTDFTIGSQNGTRYFAGSVDDVRIYNRAISASEILQIMSGSGEGPCFPHAASANAILFNSFVVDAIVVDGGCGYTNPPTVTISGGGGSNATATATISNGVVTRINITGAGCCYTNEPKLIISSPPFSTSVTIRVSKFKVIQHVMVGRRYVLESSSDLLNWSVTGTEFIAEAEDVAAEVDGETNGRYFRVREIIGSP